MANRPHPVWPIQVDEHGHLAVAEQDSDRDVASCIATCLLWPLGTRDLNPEFGIRNPLFRQDGADLGHIREQLLVNESRTDELIDDTDVSRLIEQVRVGFNQQTARPLP